MERQKKIKDPLIGELRPHWGWILGLGILFLIFGFIGLSMVVGLTVMSMFFFGVLLLLSGITHFIDVFKHSAWREILAQSLIAALYIIGACIIFYDPLLASIIVTALLAIVFIGIGVTRLVMACVSKQGWGWLVLAGIAALVLGMLILLHWPMSGVWVIGLFIAVDLIVIGWTYIIISLSLRAT